MTDQFHDTTGYLLVQVAKGHRTQIAKGLAQLGLHIGQDMVLLHLWRQDGLTQSELVESLQVEPPTVSKMMGRMEKAGLVERKRDIQDARVSRIYLTELGRELQHEVQRCWERVEEQMLSEVTLEERLLLRRLLLQLRSNLA